MVVEPGTLLGVAPSIAQEAPAWSPACVPPSCTGPSPRGYAAMAYDPSSQAVVLMGGEDAGQLKLSAVEDALERYREAFETAQSRPNTAESRK